MRQHWLLDPAIRFLNHGSFGATPRVVLEQQTELRNRMEREPVIFLVRELEGLLDVARERVAAFVGAAPEEIALVANATAGVNAVLRSLDLDKNDELVISSQEYNATRNTLDFVAGLVGAKVVTTDIPFPIASPDEVTRRVLEAVTSKTRLVVIDHITSQTGLLFPIEQIVTALNERGVDTLVDGAHAPGMVPLNLHALNATYYTANLHKWVCAPKGAAFLYVPRNRQYSIRPTSISHGATSTRDDRSRFLVEFDWTGTLDPTAWLSVPAALDFMASLLPGGWPSVMQSNHAKALQARDILCTGLGITAPAPDEMIGSMAAVPLPDGVRTEHGPALYGDPLQDSLLHEYRIEAPIVAWPASPKRVLRISAQLYNSMDEYEALASALKVLLSSPSH